MRPQSPNAPHSCSHFENKKSVAAKFETFAILQGLEVVNSAKVTCIIIHSGSASIGGSGNTRNEDIQGHPKKGEGSKELEFCDLDPNFWASKSPKLKCRPRKNPENRLSRKWPFWCCISVFLYYKTQQAFTDGSFNFCNQYWTSRDIWKSTGNPPVATIQCWP